MNIYDYIDDYGIYSFKEKKFNDVDSAIFSFIVYANLKYIIKNKDMKISEAGTISSTLYKKIDNNIVAVRQGNELISYIRDVKRYKDCILTKFEINESPNKQFSAISIEYAKNKVFVSFEGTNELFSGWKENLLLSYKFPTKSQVLAVSYLNRNYTFSKKKIILGGHSKGGNLAQIAGMYANYLVRNKIEYIYSMDGPGLLKHQFNSKRYKSIQKKYKHIIPDYSIVGLFFNNSNNYVVKAKVRNIFSHSIFYWEISKNYNFIKTDLSTYSKDLQKGINTWLAKYDNDDKKEFIDNLTYILQQAKVNSILDLKTNKDKVINLIKEYNAITPTTKKVLIEFIKIVLACYESATIKDIKDKIKEILKF